MKLIHTLALTAFAFITFAILNGIAIICTPVAKEKVSDPNDITNTIHRPAPNQIEIITFDSCEYIAYSIGYQEGILTHKGNCKFCQQRKSNSCTTKE